MEPIRPAGRNWAGNLTYGAVGVARPEGLDELREVLAGHDRVRALGSRHSFSDLTDTTGVLVDLSALPGEVAVDADRRSVSVAAGTRYGDLARALEAQGWALANLASLPHISVAGAVATGTHGSGVRNGSLATSVRALDIMGADGAVRHLERGGPDFAGSVVALGALGVVVALELDVEPTFGVRQQVRTGLTWEEVEASFEEITSAAYSVSLFTRFDDEQIVQLWVKSREDDVVDVERYGAAATEVMHMLLGGAPEAVTEQFGAPGPWLDRLPHFRMEFTPSNGEELQSEYFVERSQALAGLAALRRVAPSFAHLLAVTEIRSIAADDLWLSGAQGRETVGFHFTWVRDEPAVRAACREIEAALVPLGARPHWGKVFELDAAGLAEVYPRLTDFAALRDRVDPDRRFHNAFLERALP